MARDNNITIIGNLTRDPELRFTPGGAAVTDIGVAWNENRRNKETQEWEKMSLPRILISRAGSI